MSENSKIEWTDHTFNPWEGCTKVSAGCLHCYAETRNHRFGNDNWGKGKPRRRTSVANWKQPLKWNQFAADGTCTQCGQVYAGPRWESQEIQYTCHGAKILWRRPRVFCASLADWLDDEVPIEWLADLLKLIHDTPNLDWLLLTKRPENFKTRLIGSIGVCSWADPSDVMDRIGAWAHGERVFQNVWIGTSVENQAMANQRIPELLKIPAKVLFLSVEPMLGPIDFHRSLYVGEEGGTEWAGATREMINWAIFGGESGTGARPCHIEWIRDGMKQCQAGKVKVFVKQLGSNHHGIPFPSTKSRNFKLKDKKGGNIAEFPEDLRIREFPV